MQAYKRWVEENGKEDKLPGIDLNPNQLFFLSFGQVKYIEKFNTLPQFESAPTITHKNCETALLSLFNAMPILRLMHGAEKHSVKSSKNIKKPLHSTS